jgi:hypothetical protein
MFRKGLSIGTIVVILVVALAAIGVGYGLWSETLKIEGTVYTGEVDVGFSGPYVTEWVDIDGIPSWEPEDKDAAAECYAWLYDADLSSDGYEGIGVQVVGAYPSYHCGVTFDVSNIGSVPVLIHQPVRTSGPAWATLDGCYDEDTQLEYGEYAYCAILIHFDNEDQVAENSVYTFTFQILAHQWNEEPGP